MKKLLGFLPDSKSISFNTVETSQPMMMSADSCNLKPPNLRSERATRLSIASLDPACTPPRSARREGSDELSFLPYIETPSSFLHYLGAVGAAGGVGGTKGLKMVNFDKTADFQSAGKEQSSITYMNYTYTSSARVEASSDRVKLAVSPHSGRSSNSNTGFHSPRNYLPNARLWSSSLGNQNSLEDERFGILHAMKLKVPLDEFTLGCIEKLEYCEGKATKSPLYTPRNDNESKNVNQIMRNAVIVWLANAYPNMEAATDVCRGPVNEIKNYCKVFADGPRRLKSYRQMELIEKNVKTLHDLMAAERKSLMEKQERWGRIKSDAALKVHKDLIDLIKRNEVVRDGKADPKAKLKTWARKIRIKKLVREIVKNKIKEQQVRLLAEERDAGTAKGNVDSLPQELARVDAVMAQQIPLLADIFEMVAKEGSHPSLPYNPNNPIWTPLRFWRFIRQCEIVGGPTGTAEIDNTYISLICVQPKHKRSNVSFGVIHFEDFLKLTLTLAADKYNTSVRSGLVRLIGEHYMLYSNKYPEIPFRVAMKHRNVERVFRKHFVFIYSLFRILARDLTQFDEVKHLQMDYHIFCSFVQDTKMIEQKHISYKLCKRLFINVQTDLRQTENKPAGRNKSYICFWEFLEMIAAMAALRFKNPLFLLDWKIEQLVSLFIANPKLQKRMGRFTLKTLKTTHRWFRR
ncbi:hypothetical protein AAMO2058_001734200 [Amorphochlora amoebiformis]